MSNKLYDRAERFIEQAMEAITEFPVKRQTLEKAVTALVNDYWFEGSELSLADEFVWDFEVPINDEKDVTPLYVLNQALRRAVLEAADFDSYAQESHQQWSQWEGILNAADALGIQAHWQHTDYELLDGVYYSLDDALDTLGMLVDVWEEDADMSELLPSYKQELLNKLPTSIGIPSSESYDDWDTFISQLAVLWTRLEAYLQNFAWNSPAFQRRYAWEHVQKCYQDIQGPLPTIAIALPDYSRGLGKLKSAIDAYLKLL